jgi:CPA2 family monovalent cation:H+ antiporter-2
MLDRSRAGPADQTPAARVDRAQRAIVVGYGPTGRTVTRLLADNGFETVVIDMERRYRTAAPGSARAGRLR